MLRPVRLPDAGRGDGVQDLATTCRWSTTCAATARASSGSCSSAATGRSSSPAASACRAEELARAPGRDPVRRPDQHPVHERHDRLPQGRHAQPPQHPQQRLLRRARLPVHRGGPGLHPGALLPLLRHGHGQPRVHVARRLHGHPGAGVRPGRDAAGGPGRAAARACTACRRCSSPSSSTREFSEFDLIVAADRDHGRLAVPDRDDEARASTRCTWRRSRSVTA